MALSANHVRLSYLFGFWIERYTGITALCAVMPLTSLSLNQNPILAVCAHSSLLALLSVFSPARDASKTEKSLSVAWYTTNGLPSASTTLLSPNQRLKAGDSVTFTELNRSAADRKSVV